ncbi:MAG: EAL domain-containing protein [Roseburia sp.]|nr:EAL domain-containing protein [Roseburia sp.]
MKKENTVLIVDDEKVNRLNLRKILGDIYEIVEAENGQQAIDILERDADKISAIVLDLIMPGFSGYQFMEVYAKSKTFGMIPVVIATVEGDSKTEKECLKLGAWDFVGKPYDSSIIQFRVKNVIDRSENQISKELRRRTQFSELTTIFNMSMFYYSTREMLNRYPEKKFALIRMDIEKFRLINAFFGRAEGNKLLKYMAEYLREMDYAEKPIRFGHMSADVFGICFAYEKIDEILTFMQETNKRMAEYPLDFDVTVVYGIYLVEDISYNVSEMYEFANQAAKTCKEEFNLQNYAFYDSKMSDDIIKEQRIVNNMRGALAGEEFVIYLQPKYELQTNTLAGAEVLVRWIDPKRGMISPGDFIPVFERNGFIMKLDLYIWEKSCQLIRKWIDEGRTPLPISVNISRVSLYNPRLVEVLCNLVDKYDIPPELFQLELTESAYTTNQNSIRNMMTTLQEKGFVVMMDDFGSGYSSLNILKDIKVDVLKIDMRFLGDTENETRSENILAAVVRMAKWLNLPVIAEGVERKEQVLFLKSIGCEYVQGYYFARPMPVADYEELAYNQKQAEPSVIDEQKKEREDILNSNSQLELLFSNMQQAVAVYEYGEGTLDVLRVNDAYFDLFGFEDVNDIQSSLAASLVADNKETLFAAFEAAVQSEEAGECEVLRRVGEREIWISVKLKYISPVGSRHIIYGYINDITARKEIDAELQKYRKALTMVKAEEETILIVDDQEVNRVSLQCIFGDKYRILEAENGVQALEVLAQENGNVDIILLDLQMPEMDGAAFLAHKSNTPELAEIPVVIITADDTTEQQIDTMRMGADEYIVKPFIPEIVTRRVENVLDSSRSFRRMSKK